MPLKKYNTASILIPSSTSTTTSSAVSDNLTLHSGSASSMARLATVKEDFKLFEDDELDTILAESKSRPTREEAEIKRATKKHTAKSPLPNKIIDYEPNLSPARNKTTSESSSVSSSSITNANSNVKYTKSDYRSSSYVMPVEVKMRLNTIFNQIEKEFEVLYKENVYLKQQLLSVDKSAILGAKNAQNSAHAIKDKISKLNDLANGEFDVEKSAADFKSESGKSLRQSSLINTNQLELLSSSLTSSSNVPIDYPMSKQLKSQSISFSSKSRINNLSFAKFKPNAKDFIMQSIKNTSAQIVNKAHSGLYNCKLVNNFLGHKDGINDINCVSIPMHLLATNATNSNCSSDNLNYNLLVGTASTDTTARLWYQNYRSNTTSLSSSSSSSKSKYFNTSFCVQEYCGHTGSVNSIRFHPRFFIDATNLILTGSGDCEAHIWQSVLSPVKDSLESNSEVILNYNTCYSIAINNFLNSNNNNNNSTTNSPQPQLSYAPFFPTNTTNYDNTILQNSLQNIEPTNSNLKYYNMISNPSLIRSPIKRYQGHTDACIAAEWFPDGEQIVTGSWDRTANVYNVETSKIMCNLQHDDYLTNVAIHKTHKIILTSSKDTTFKVWDFRDPICSVQIYQGHNRSVNSAIFVGDDKIATSSDDHHLKLWDLRVMRSPVFSINMNSSINRICTMTPNFDSTTNESFICIPLDNREIKIYNLQGERIMRLPRNRHIGHMRPVTCLASHGSLLLSASHDKTVNCWSFELNSSKSLKFSQKENTDSNLTMTSINSSAGKHLKSHKKSSNNEKNSSLSSSPPDGFGLQINSSSSNQNNQSTCLNANMALNNNASKNINSLSKLTELIKI